MTFDINRKLFKDYAEYITGRDFPDQEMDFICAMLAIGNLTPSEVLRLVEELYKND